jgi:hypothetical protein
MMILTLSIRSQIPSASFGIILRLRSVCQEAQRLTPKPDEGIDPVSWISVLPTFCWWRLQKGKSDEGALRTLAPRI